MRTYIRRHHYICGTTVISLLFSVTSCSTVRVDELSPSTDWIHHVVHADQRGRLQTKYFPNGHCGSEQNDDYNDSEERYLALVDCHNQSIINNLATYTSQTSKPKILIFIHGGLNEDIDTLKRAIRDTPRLMDDGYYPIFFNWHSDGPGAYRDQVLNVRQGNLHNDTRGRITRMLSAPLYVLSDALEAVAGAPAVWFNQMFNPDEPYIGYEDEHWVENSQPLRSWDDVSHRNNVIFDDSPYDPYITPSHLAQLAPIPFT